MQSHKFQVYCSICNLTILMKSKFFFSKEKILLASWSTYTYISYHYFTRQYSYANEIQNKCKHKFILSLTKEKERQKM